MLSGQSCRRLTASDLGSEDTASSDGLIPAALAASVPQTFSIQLLNYSIVCESTSVTVGEYRSVSVVAEYSLNGSSTLSQFEFACNSSMQWDIVVSGLSTEIVTTPPDATLNTALRRDCIQCISPERTGTVNNNNTQHCSGKSITRLMWQCTS